MAIRKYAGDRITCLSTDTKPVNMADGAFALETNTDKWFQLTGGAWVEINDPNIAINAGNIATNASDISSNTSDIATNASNIGTVANDLTTHEDNISNPHQVTLEQARTVLNQLNGNIDFNDNDIDNLKAVGFKDGQDITWNQDYHTVDIPSGFGNVLQVGQELYFLIYNDTGVTVPNATVIKPDGAITNGIQVPTFRLARADKYENCYGTLWMTTHDVPHGQFGMATIIGRVGGLDLSNFAIGGPIFLSPTEWGGYTHIRPEFPNYEITLGGALNNTSDSPAAITFSGRLNDTFDNVWNGTFRETIRFEVTSDGSTITGTLQQKGGGDLTMLFSDGFKTLDCTPPQTLTLIPGTSTDPQHNFVYITRVDKVLAVSTTGFPTHDVEHIKVADLYLRDAVSTQGDGALVNRNWNDHVTETVGNGHVTHVTERLRQNPAAWYSGAEGICTIDSPTNSNVHVSATGGYVYQLHKQTWPSLDTALGDDIHIVNDSVSPYTGVTNLNTLTIDANGNSLGNKSFSFVLWGVQNSSSETCHLMLNLPSGSYAKNDPDAAVNDADNLSVYSIPPAFNGKGFLIARFTYTLSTNGLDWSLYATEDLRGKIPNTSAGGGGGTGGGGVTTFTALTDTPATYIGQAGKIVKVGTGESALEFVTDTSLQNSDIGVIVQPYDANTVIDAAYVHTDNNFTDVYQNDIALNNAKVGITTQQSADIVTNNAKLSATGTELEPTDIGVTVQGYDANTVIDSAYVHTDNNFTNVYKAEVDANTLKVGITGQQSSDIIANNAKISADANATNQGNTFNGVSQLVQTNGSGQLPAIDGSLLTNLPSGGVFSPGSGTESAQLGNASVASGARSYAHGLVCLATANYSWAHGERCEATGLYSFAHGKNADALGSQAVAFGDGTVATGNNSIAMGYRCLTPIAGGVAIGSGCEANSFYTVAIGQNCDANGNYSVSVGNGNVTNGYYGFTSGYKTIATGYASTAIGTYGIEHVGDVTTAKTDTNVLFSIGNGTSSERSDAFQVITAGQVYAPDLTTTMIGAESSVSKILITKEYADANYLGGGGDVALIDLTDVSTVDYTSGYALMANGSSYASRAIVSADISNFDTSVSSNADVTANTAKISYTDAAAVALNTAKVGYTDVLVSANSDVVANTAKVGITTQQATDITTNNAKVGVTDEEANTINSEPIGNESQVLQVVSISQADYDLITPVATTLYIITD